MNKQSRARRLSSLRRISKIAFNQDAIVRIVKNIHDTGRKSSRGEAEQFFDDDSLMRQHELSKRIHGGWLEESSEGNWEAFTLINSDSPEDRQLPKLYLSFQAEEDIMRMLCEVAGTEVGNIYSYDDVVKGHIFDYARERVRDALLYIDKTEDKEYLSPYAMRPETWPQLYIKMLDSYPLSTMACKREMA
jgi:hypothetical protein